MTQEEKQLLLVDLCGRLPYYPKCEIIDELRVINNEKDSSYISTLFPKHIELFSYHNNFTIKPYLHPMSSMTEEEFVYFMGLRGRMLQSYEIQSMMKEAFNMPQFIGIGTTLGSYSNKIDWLLKNHFDYRGLIEKGLAIKVTEENNPYKE